MKIFAIIVAAGFCFAASAAIAQDKPAPFKDQKDKVSYSIGLDVGVTFKKQNLDINPDVFMAGLRDALSGKTPQMNEAQVKETMTAFQKEMMEKESAKSKEAGAKNAGVGEKFLAENKTKEGVKTTASGLQFKVLKEGNGPTPKASDTVVTHYRGTLIDGTEFDSSYKRGEPATFPVSGVIKGWTEALQLMKVGSKYQLFIPPNLAYGERGAGQDIGPNATLVFEVELLEVKAPAAGSSPAGAEIRSAASPSPSATSH
jgi:FKBP-type peptidyl-prolyl cis-trans isomerase FklB